MTLQERYKLSGQEIISVRETGEELTEQEQAWVANIPMKYVHSDIDRDTYEMYGSELLEEQKEVSIVVPEKVEKLNSTTSDVLTAATRGRPTGKETGIYLFLALYLEALQHYVGQVPHAIVVGSYGWGTIAHGDDFDLAVVTEQPIPEAIHYKLREWWDDMGLPSPSLTFATVEQIKSRIGSGADYFERLLKRKGFDYYSEAVGPRRNIIAELQQLRSALASEQVGEKLSETTLAAARKIVQPINIGTKTERRRWSTELPAWEISGNFDLIASVSGNNILAEALARYGYMQHESFAFERFDDKEGRMVVPAPEKVEGKNVLLVHSVGYHGDEDFVQLLLAIAGLRDFGARSINVLIPETMESRARHLVPLLQKFVSVWSTADDNFGPEGVSPLKVTITPVQSSLEVPARGKSRELAGNPEILLFTRSRAKLHKEVADAVQSSVAVGRVDVTTLKNDRTTDVKFYSDEILGKKVLLFHTTKTDRGLVQLLSTLHALREAGAERITLLLGYMGYSRGHENYPAKEYGPTAQAVNMAKFVLEIIKEYTDELVTVNVHFLKNIGDDHFLYLKNPRQFTRKPAAGEYEYLDLRIRNVNALGLLVRYYL